MAYNYEVDQEKVSKDFFKIVQKNQKEFKNYVNRRTK